MCCAQCSVPSHFLENLWQNFIRLDKSCFNASTFCRDNNPCCLNFWCTRCLFESPFWNRFLSAIAFPPQCIDVFEIILYYSWYFFLRYRREIFDRVADKWYCFPLSSLWRYGVLGIIVLKVGHTINLSVGYAS